ncbi:hypothetical protein FA09DRAFT_362674, partial [Tilletiopsis washingtonensis]
PLAASHTPPPLSPTPPHASHDELQGRRHSVAHHRRRQLRGHDPGPAPAGVRHRGRHDQVPHQGGRRPRADGRLQDGQPRPREAHARQAQQVSVSCRRRRRCRHCQARDTPPHLDPHPCL